MNKKNIDEKLFKLIDQLQLVKEDLWTTWNDQYKFDYLDSVAFEVEKMVEVLIYNLSEVYDERKKN
jgi:hypothetical protein